MITLLYLVPTGWFLDDSLQSAHFVHLQIKLC